MLYPKQIIKKIIITSRWVVIIYNIFLKRVLFLFLCRVAVTELFLFLCRVGHAFKQENTKWMRCGMVGWLSLRSLDTNLTLTYHYEHLPSLHEGHVDNRMMLMLHEAYAPVLQEPKAEGRITKTGCPSK